MLTRLMMFLACILFLSLKFYVSCSPGASLLESLTGAQGAEYIGCYRDKPDRDLRGALIRDNVGNTPRKCINLCKSRGYTYAGVQLGYICLCGNSFGRHGHVPESRCQTKCNGDRAQKCGGAWANAVYKVSNQDNPCQGPTKKGFGNQFEHDEYGFVTYLEMGDGETFSSCWSMEFYASSLSQMGFYRVRVLQIAFYHHYITSDEACIQVYSGIPYHYDTGNDLLGTFCGVARPPLTTGFTSPATILYHTNNTRNGQSFEAVFNVIDEDGQCGGILTEPEGQIISVDRDGNGLYDTHLSCRTIIAAPKNVPIEIIFIDFNLTGASPDICVDDFLSLIDTGTLLERYCGDTIPPRITTTANIAQVLFITSNKEPWKKTHSGFLAEYRFLNEHRVYYWLNDTVEYIEYFDDGETGRAWSIQAGDDKIIQLVLTHLNISTTKPCTDNYLKVKTSTGYDDMMYCRSELPPLIETTSYLTLELQLTQNLVGVGFKAIYTIADNTFLCGEILTVSPWQINHPVGPVPWDFLDDFKSTYFDDVYDVDLDCTWIIIAPNHYQITLEFGQIDIEGQYPCPFDYIQIIGSYYINGTVVFPRICGDEIPGKIVSPANIMYVRFVTDDLYSRKGFNINGEFKYKSAQSCGGELSESVDTFGIMLNELQSSSDTACHWAINNEQMRTIELKIFRLHLPNDDTCTSAFIELYYESGAVGKLCGIGPQPVQVFTATQLHIYFFSKDKYPGFGFEAIYSISDGTYANQSSILTQDGPQFLDNPETHRIGTYDHMLDLQWTIILEPGKIVQLFFQRFHIESSKDCLYDRLKMAMFHVVSLVECIILNLYDLLECVVM